MRENFVLNTDDVAILTQFAYTVYIKETDGYKPYLVLITFVMAVNAKRN